MILDYVVLKLTILHVLNQWQIEFWHIILVHVQQNVTDHNDALLNLLPNSIELSKKLLIVGHFDILTDWLEQLHRGVLHTLIQHLPVLVQNKTVGSTVELLIAKTTCLLVVDLVDSVLDSFPVLLCL